MRVSFKAGCTGMLLLEVAAYSAMLIVVFGLATAAFYAGWENHHKLIRNADDIIRAVEAGEQWRADVRQASGPLILEMLPEGEVLRLPGGGGETVYRLAGDKVIRWRQGGSNELFAVRSSKMTRHFVAGGGEIWQWEIELAAESKAARVRPLFSFKAVRLP